MALSGVSTVSSGLGGDCKAGRGRLSSSVLGVAAWGGSLWGLQPMPFGVGSGSGDPLSRRSLLALRGVLADSVLFPAGSCGGPRPPALSCLPSPLELPPAFTKAVELEAMAWKPVMVPTGPGRPLRSAGGPRVSWMFPLRMLRVRARADSSGYMVSRIFTEFSGGAATAGWAAASGGRRPGTGRACFGVAAQNCRGDDKTLSSAGADDGDGEAHGGEQGPGSSGGGDVTGGASGSDDGDIGQSGDRGEEGLELETRGDAGLDVRGGVAIRGASSGGSGGPTSCRILLSVSTQQSAGVDVSAVARMVCVLLLWGFP